MDLRQRVNTALKQAMKDKAPERLGTLRLISAAIKDRDIEARSADDDPGASDADILQILGKMVRQRNESAKVYEEGSRLDLAERERAEIEIITEFLPRQMSDEEVDQAIKSAIKELSAESLRDMGRVIGLLKEKHTGQMDFGSVGPKVKDLLA